MLFSTAASTGMEFVGKVFTTVSEFYNDINPATLSGAIDIVVVEQPDGSLHCSPFHVRFGKMQLLRPQEKNVEFKVNGNVVNFPMKVGDAGDAFFVVETDRPVPFDLETSPPTGPQPASGEMLAVADFQLDPNNNKADSSLTDSFTQLDEFHSVKSPNKSLVTIDQQQQDNNNGSGNSLKSGSSSNQDSITPKTAAEGSFEELVKPMNVSNAVSRGQLAKLLITTSAGSDEGKISELENRLIDTHENAGTAAGSIISSHFQTPAMKADSILNTDLHIPPSDYEEDAVFQSPALNLIDTGFQFPPTPSPIQKQPTTLPIFIPTSINSSASTRHSTGHIAMDSSRQAASIETTYPLSDTEYELSATPPPTNWDRPMPSSRAAELGPLSDTELDYSDFSGGGASLGVKRSSVSNVARTSHSVLTKHRNSSLTSLHKRESKEIVSDGLVPLGDQRVLKTSQFIINSVPLDSATQTIPGGWSMSLCGPKLTDANAKEIFEKYLVPWDNFQRTPAMISDPNLIFRYEGRYYTWEYVAPVFVSLFMFQQNLPASSSSTLLHQAQKSITGITNQQVPMSDTSPSKQSQQLQASSFTGWRGWWSRSTTAAMDNNTFTDIQAPITLDRSPSPPKPALSTKSSPIRDEAIVAQQIVRSSSAPAPEILKSQSQSDNLEPASPPPRYQRGKRYTKTLRLTSDQLKSLDLKFGPNEVSFAVNTNFSGKAVCNARIFLWKHDVQVVISDIDGTITKSDALGHLFSMVGKDWTHPGIANLYTKVHRNGYEFLYLTSRAIGQADWTRIYLRGIEQNRYNLPDGPVIMSPDRLIAALKREVIDRRPEEFKIAALTDIRSLFGGRNPFYAGFGNRITDALSYRAVDIPAYRIYSIDPRGHVKMDFFYGYSSSYVKLTDLVDHIFPHIRKGDSPITTPPLVKDGSGSPEKKASATSTLSRSSNVSTPLNSSLSRPGLNGSRPLSSATIDEEELQPLVPPSSLSSSFAVKSQSSKFLERSKTQVSTISVSTAVSSTAAESYNDYHYWRNVPELPADELPSDLDESDDMSSDYEEDDDFDDDEYEVSEEESAATENGKFKLLPENDDDSKNTIATL